MHLNEEQFKQQAKEKLDDINWDEYFDKMEQEEKKKQIELSNFKQNRMNDCIKEMFEILQEVEYLDNEELSYTENKYNFSYKEFEMLFDLLLNYAEDNNLLVNSNDSSFCEKDFVFNYNEVLITGRIAHGQGTMEQLRINYENELEDNYKQKIFIWNDFINDKKWITKIIKEDIVKDTIQVDRNDFLKALEQWYWLLDECNDWENKKFNEILKKYNITIDNLMRI